MRDLCDAVDEPVAQGGDLLRVLVHVGAGLFQGCSHRRDAGDVFRAAALAALLRAALDEVREDDAAAGIEHADALRPVELVGGEAQHVDVHLIDVDLHVARRLDGVGVEQYAALMTHRADLPDGLDGADLVVGEHDGHEAGVVADGVGDLLRGDEPVRVHVEQRHLKALLFQALEGVQHGVVLERGGNDVLFALARADVGRGGDGLVVRLAAAGGKVDLARLGSKTGCHIGPGRLEHFLGLLADGIEARRVAEGMIQMVGHRVDGRLVHSGGRCVIRIDLHQYQLLCMGYLFSDTRIAYIPHKVNRFIGWRTSEKLKHFFRPPSLRFGLLLCMMGTLLQERL